MSTLIVICQSGGKFSSASDGSLSYVGGDAHAISVSRETKFDELRLEIAEMWKVGTDSMTIKYFLPNNKRTLITISSDKDVQSFLDFHGNSGTVDVFVIKNESSTALAADTPSTTDATPVPPRKRSTRKRVVQQEYPLNVTPVAQAPAPAFLSSASENPGQFNSLATVPTEIQSDGQMKRVKLWENCITGLHQQFNNVCEVRDALRKYSIAQGFTVKFKKNDSMRVSAKCSVDGCPWRIFASRLSTTHLFRIKRLNEIHTCGNGTSTDSHPRASKKVVEGIVKEKLRDSPNVKPKEIANQIQQEFGIELRYSQVRRWMEAATEEIQGSYKEAYNQLPWLREKIVETNPGSVVSLNTREDQSFHRLFIAFHASLHGFQSGCRPLLFLDTMSLQSKYQSELLTAAAVDGNYGIFPVAFGVVDVVNDDNWHWFLVQLKSALPTFQAITFVADRQMGLKQSISVIFENSYHAYCLRYLSEELKRDLKGPCIHEIIGAIIGHLYDAAYAPTRDAFGKCIESIRSISPEAYDWIWQSDPGNWANSYFLGARYNHITSGIAEPFYSWLAELTALPIIKIIETIRHKLMELIYTRKVESDQWVTRLTPSLEDKLQKEILNTQSLQVTVSDGNTFKVHDIRSAFNDNDVEIDAWVCSCGEWQLTGFPCLHAVAVLLHIHRDVYDYCSKYYTTEAFRLTYSESIKPVPTVDKPVLGESSEVLVNPAPLRCVSGSPKKRRIRSSGVVKRPLHCSRCKGEGHNKVSCNVVS
ncbi:MuDR family transposase [Salix suchowensis]|nr:MuDR family transposase [Salix suchowensis]